MSQLNSQTINLNEFWEIVKGIKELKIQGAENIAKCALRAMEIVFEHYLKLHSHIKLNDFHLHLISAKHILEKTRPTEPMMRNFLNYVIDFDAQTLPEFESEFKSRIAYLHRQMHDAEQTIAKLGARLIKDGMIIFTHCHSSTVMKILKYAKDQGKHFEVHNTETRPRFQGRITARELSEYGIKVVHYVDSAARIALKDADLFLFGADAITAQGKVINKIGTEMFAEIAKEYGAEVYSATNSLKYDPMTFFKPEDIEMRNPDEVWPNHPENVTIMNYAFEQVHPELIDGIITELGITKPQTLQMLIKERYPWVFKK